jgi:DDE superfamily endonuclease
MKIDKILSYRNRKQSLSQNVMAVCDFDRRFTCVMARWEGSASDATVLKSALDDGFTVPQCKYYLVDAGHANTPKLLAPYRGLRYHVKEQGLANERPRNYRELFNLQHAKLRNHIERIIGVLKMRFPILKVATYHTIDAQIDIVQASCTLHNFIVNHNGELSWTRNPRYQTINPNEIVGHQMREEIAKHMWNDYDRYRRNRDLNTV